MKVVALHGFLGSAADFAELKDSPLVEKSWIPNLFLDDKEFLSQGFEYFTERAADKIHHEFKSEKVKLVGYSLGGRLALHLALKHPDIFDQVILASTHPGVFDKESILVRRTWEQSWIEELKQKNFAQFSLDWNSQDIFAGEPQRSLAPEHFDKETLEKALSLLSNTRHNFTLSDLRTHPEPLTWAVGADDRKFNHILSAVRSIRGEKDHYVVVPQRGHRLVAGKDLTWLYPLFS